MTAAASDHLRLGQKATFPSSKGISALPLEAGHSCTAAKAAGWSRSRNEQRLHVCAARHAGIRRLEVFAQFSHPDERARNKEGVFQVFSLPECDVEKGIAEIGPLGLVLAAE